MLQSMGSQRVEHDLMTEHNNNSQKVESGTSEGKGMQDNKD